MDIVKHKRDMEHHHSHMMRLRNMTAHIDTSTPSSLGLKHLATRPKKQQLIDDRHHQVAKENRKLMEKMTKIMASSNPIKRPLKLGSLNEIERRHETSKLNYENMMLMERLKTVPPVIDRERQDKDFMRHKVVGGQLRRRQLQPLDAMEPISPSKSKSLIGNETFDAQTYLTHQSSGAFLPNSSSIASDFGSSLGGQGPLSGGVMADGSLVPMKTMSEFRKQVISTKKMAPPPGVNRDAGKVNRSVNSDNYSDSRFEMSHTPS